MTSLPHCGSAGGDVLRRLLGAIGSTISQLKQGRQCSHNHCCCGKAASVKYVRLFFVTWRAGNIFTAPYHIVMCGLPGATKVFHIIS